MANYLTVFGVVLTLGILQWNAPGPAAAYEVCQMGCSVVAAACFSAAGGTFGVS